MNHNHLSATTTPAAIALTIRRKLVQAVDYGLLALGETVRDTIYHRIQTTRGVGREEIPEKLESFHEALRELLGTYARVIEKLIAKNFYSRLGLSFTEHKTWTLVDYVTNTLKGERSSQLDSKEISAASVSARVAPTISTSNFEVSPGTASTGTRDRFEFIAAGTSKCAPVGLQPGLRTVTSLMYTFPSVTTWLQRGPR